MQQPAPAAACWLAKLLLGPCTCMGDCVIRVYRVRECVWLVCVRHVLQAPLHNPDYLFPHMAFSAQVPAQLCGRSSVIRYIHTTYSSPNSNSNVLIAHFLLSIREKNEGMEMVEVDRLESMDVTGGENGAATKLQKVYRSYRSRRELADSAVVDVGQLWWQALDFARLSHSTVSFFDKPKPETAASRWNRVSLNASKVGQGSSRDVDGKADKMAFEYWLEAIDPRHRYGRSLHFYYDGWCQSQTGQPFFYWLDVGEGKDIDLPECPRALLKNQCIRYLGPQEREHYEYSINEGKIIHKQSEEPLDTSRDPEGTQWIFVMSTAKRLYVGKKERGVFQHSSFLAGGVTIVAGRVFAENGVIKSIWAYSGHYKPSKENINNFMNFLEENGVDLKDVEFRVYGLGVLSHLDLRHDQTISPRGH